MFDAVRDILVYMALFAGLYFQVFLLISYFLWDGTTEYGEIDMPSAERYEPMVAVMVPCYNEEKTVVGTVESLLALDYPREKLRVVVIDDGSKDNTWQVVQKFAGNQSVVLLQKENEGSKFAALNYGLRYIREHMQDMGVIGCLDADSSVDTMALRESLKEFTKPGVMAVVPSMIIDHPKSFFQWMQKVEYELGTYAKQVFSRLNTLYIAPGPFSLFRKEVFEEIGEYHEAHHVEDMQLALRMQIAGMRLSHAIDSIVYTKGPRTWSALLKQRIRWTYGFLMNVWDYRRQVFFSDTLGHVAVTIPILFFMVGVVVVMFPILIIGLLKPAIAFIERISVTHQVTGQVHLDPFYISPSFLVIVSIVTYIIFVITIVIGRRSLLRQKKIVTLDLLTTLIYPLFASWWTIRSAANAVRRKKSSWR
jgi:cellulose synthase/poly-beta-1,6-N-acetylglucosamine synthase-like glycosyltransferase